MANDQQELTADLGQLWLAGARYLPQIADQFAAAASDLSVSEAQDGYFWRPAEFMTGGYGPVCEGLRGLRDTMLAVLRDSEANMRDTGRALATAADRYAEAEGVNEAAFRAEKQRLQQRGV